MTVGTGCTEKKAALNDTLSSDSLLADTSDAEDSLETIISEEPMPKAADELFDDFFFNFAANRRLQRERIDFPLAVNSYGKMTSVTQRRWRTEHFFMHQGYYTLVFNNASASSYTLALLLTQALPPTTTHPKTLALS